MYYKSRAEELEEISRSLSERLRRLCANMSEDDFAVMIARMAEVQWRSEHVKSDTSVAAFLPYTRRPGSRD